LIAQGIGNMAASFFGGLGAGATMRTVVNIKSGVKNIVDSQFSALLY